MSSILLQLILQLYYQVYANEKFIESKLGSLHGVVWLIYSIYALLNVRINTLFH